MLDLRYHIASLVAVFLALGLGILVGGAVIGFEPLLGEREALTAKLEQDFARLREENEAARAQAQEAAEETAFYRSYAEEVLPQVVAGSLQGLKVCAITTPNLQLPDELPAILTAAGANLGVMSLGAGAGTGGGPLTIEALATPGTEGTVAEAVGNYLVTGTEEGVVQDLVAKGLLLPSTTVAPPYDLVLLVTPVTARDWLLQEDFIGSLGRAGVPAVGVLIGTGEANAKPWLRVGSSRQGELTVIEGIETAPGLNALVSAMAGSIGEKPETQPLTTRLKR